jgi:hypothetical protein
MYAENNDFLDRPALDAYINIFKIRYVIPFSGALMHTLIY